MKARVFEEKLTPGFYFKGQFLSQWKVFSKFRSGCDKNGYRADPIKVREILEWKKTGADNTITDALSRQYEKWKVGRVYAENDETVLVGAVVQDEVERLS